MHDREKVIKGLEHCLSRYVDGLCDDCPYMGELDKSYKIPMKCKEIIMRDTLALLKEQEAEKPIAKEDDMFECCTCGAIVGWDELDASGIVQTRFNYCPYCGKGVKWE